MSTLKFQLVTPEKVVLTEELESLSCPTTMGQITILPGHIPLIATLTSGELVAKATGGERFIHVAGGFIEIKKDNSIIALADAAEHVAEIDEQRALQAKQQAEDILKQSHISDEEYAQAASMLARNTSRLRLVRKHAHRKDRPITSEGVFEE